MSGATASTALERLREGLLELDLSPAQLREDPEGCGWLPAELAELVASDEACRAELDEFVALELALYEGGTGASDAVFTARVMAELPEVDTTDAGRRTWILAAAHALAIGVAYLILWPPLRAGELAQVLDGMHGWLDASLTFAAPWALALIALLVVAVPSLVGGARRVEA